MHRPPSRTWRRIGFAAAFLTALAFPSLSSAATVSLNGGILAITDATGADDGVTLSRVDRYVGDFKLGTDVVVADTAGITDYPEGCRPTDPASSTPSSTGSVSCPTEMTIRELRADLGGGDDTLDTTRLGMRTTFLGGAGSDTLFGGVGADVFQGGPGDDTADSGGGKDFLYGEDGNDTLSGGAADDTLDGGAGDDVLFGGANADDIAGGAGSDTVAYDDPAHTSGVTVTQDGQPDDGSAADVTSTTGGTRRDNVADDVEVLRGTAHADALAGGNGDNVLQGLGGADVLTGGAGIDTVDYSDHTTAVSITQDGAANDGSDGEGDSVADDIEVLRGSPFDDTIAGGPADNVLQGMGGADTLSGGAGFDTVDYSDHTDGVTVDLGSTDPSQGSAADTSADGARRDSIAADVEGLIGSPAADVLTGSARDDTIAGGAGADTIDGGGGADTIDAGTGDDRLLLRDGVADTASCGDDAGDSASADAIDVLTGCASVELPAPPAEQPTQPTGGDTQPTAGSGGGGEPAPTSPEVLASSAPDPAASSAPRGRTLAIQRGPMRVSRSGRGRLRVSCLAPGACVGRLTLVYPGPRGRQVVVARATLRLAAGQRRLVTIRMLAFGRRVIARQGGFIAIARVAVTNPDGTARTDTASFLIRGSKAKVRRTRRH